MSLPKGLSNKVASNNDINRTPFLMFQAHQDDFQKLSKISDRANQVNMCIKKCFFHPKNIAHLQKRIIAYIFKKTKGEYLIDKQNESDLKAVMASVYENHQNNHKKSVLDTIKELNMLVVQEVSPDIIGQIKAYDAYLARAFGPRFIMDRPENVSSAGTKYLPSVTSLY